MAEHILFQGKRIAYYLDGDPDALPLVLLHGFCEDRRIWDEFLEDLTDCRIIRIDISGFGESELMHGYTIEWLADSVNAVLDHIGVAKCIFVGHSMGGYVGAAFAQKYTARLLGLGMFHTHPFEDTEEKKADRDKGIRFIRNYGHELFVKQLIPGLFSPIFVTSNGFLIDKLVLRAARCPTEAFITALVAMKDRPDHGELFKNLPFPLLFIIGQLDKTVPYEISLRQTHLPKIADIHIFPKEAHMGMYLHKEETAALVNNFITFCKEFA